jgi:hypothetical protein
MSARSSWWARDTTPGYALLIAAAASFALHNGPFASLTRAILETPLISFSGAFASLRDAVTGGAVTGGAVTGGAVTGAL